MDTPSTRDVKEVKVINSDYEDAVNHWLANGWILLHVYSQAIDSDHGPSQTGVYVLGRTSSKGSG